MNARNRKSIVSGAAMSAKSAASGSMSATFPTSSSRIARTPPAAPRITPSITNGQRMNQFVAPTRRITSTSRRREKSESRIVFATSRIDATTSSTERIAVVSFTTRVADRILSVSSRRFLTSSIAGSPVPASALRSAPMLSGSSGVTRNVSGSGFEPSSW
jgi:hypothetical protein